MFTRNLLRGSGRSDSKSSPPATPVPSPSPVGKGCLEALPAPSKAPEVVFPGNSEEEEHKCEVNVVRSRLCKNAGQRSNHQSLESVCSTSSQAEYASISQTIIIFDWDDTLCPSHFIRVNRPRLHYFQPCPNDPKFKVPLGQLAELVIRALRDASKLGKVIILTNAQPQWVEISCRNFLPGVWAVIRELDIDIVYARVGFESDLTTTNSEQYNYNYNANIPQLWKEKAMKEHLNKFYSRYLHQSWKNIISIGDQTCEHNACRIVALNRPSAHKTCRIKTLKLLEEPGVEDLISELQVITQWLGGLARHNGDLDLDLSNDESIIFDMHNLLTTATVHEEKNNVGSTGEASPTSTNASGSPLHSFSSTASAVRNSNRRND